MTSTNLARSAAAVAALLIGAAPAAAKTAPRGVHYGGSSSEGDPVVVQLSASGKQVVGVAEEFEAKCASGRYIARLSRLTARLPISAKGAFTGVEHGFGDLGGGQHTDRTVTVKGLVNGRSMTGSLTYHADVLDTQGAKVDTCDQTATFKASAAKGKVYAGYTAQRAPVVMELTATRKAVHHFHIGWTSDCADNGFLQIGDTLLNFPVSGGAFGDDFSINYGEPAGEHETIDYSVHGKIAVTKATGTFSAKLAETAADGTQSSCDTGSVAFTAATG